MPDRNDGDTGRRPASADPAWHIAILERIAREAFAAYEQSCQDRVRVRTTKGRVTRGKAGELIGLPEQVVTEVVPARPDRRLLAVANRALADLQQLRAFDLPGNVAQPPLRRRSRRQEDHATLDLPLDLILLPRLDLPTDGE